jgi:ElaB/YqjD/DUF883 family membrane-anchored ribosome-binding protein
MTATEGTPNHLTLVQHFEEAFDQTQDERKLAERDRDYYDGKQLTAEEEETLRKRGQPIVISNRIAPKVDALLGHERRMRTDPRAYPRTPKHEQEADSITDAIRFVCDSNRFSAIRSCAAENLLIEGIAAATVSVTMGKQAEVKITHVPWDRFYRDPHSRKRDFSDAQYLGVVLWMDESEALEKFKGKEGVVQGCYTDSETVGDTFDDRPSISWSDRRRKRIRVLQHRFRHKGAWHTAILCKGGFLRDPQVSPYVDEDGTPQCDLIATSAYIDRENNRYGVVRRHISPQDEINKRRSKALHLLNSKQVITEKGAVDSIAQAKREVAKPDGMIEVNPSMRFEVIEQPGLVAGQLQLLQEAKNEIDASGVNPAIEGDASAPSGRAQEMLLQAGLSEMASVFEAVKDWSWEIYRQVWFRIRQYWNEERWVRVTDDERNMLWVALNKPITQADVILEQNQLPPEQAEQIKADPLMQQQVGMQNAIAELDVDLILEEGPDSITIQSEQYQALIELKKSDPAAIPTRMIIEASSLRNKDQLLEHLEQGGVPPEMQQQMQEMQKALEEAQQKLAESEQKCAATDQEAQAMHERVQAEIKSAQAEMDKREAQMEAAHARWERDQIMAELERLRPQQSEPETPPESGVSVE